MKIGCFADREWAYEIFEKVSADERFQIVFIVLDYDKPDENLRKMAQEKGIPVIVHKNINSKEFIDEIEKYEAELFVAMYFGKIFKEILFSYPKYGMTNCHPGKLPFYRGRCALNWALINDEREFGITIHYVDAGIDTGDIILQNVYPITDKDDYGTLQERAYKASVETYYEALQQIYNGNVKTVKQKDIDAVGMYCGLREPGDEIIDWKQSSREVFNFVRALVYPGPGAASWIKGKKIRINKIRMIPESCKYKGIPGQVIGKTEEGFIVKTGDTIVEVIDFVYEGKIRITDRLRPEE